MRAEKSRTAFTLVESVLAIALFAMAAAAIAQVCYNSLYALDMEDKNAEEDVLKDQFLAAVMNIADYDALDDGADVDGIDGETYRVYGYAEPTDIIDLFSLEAVAQRGTKEIRQKIFVIRPNWYQDTNLRAELLDDRTEFLEDKRQTEGDAK